ncbi:hypothetical protein FGO68_gene3767 [Halteria grandinella]|uniref:Uncharacterized protein n=1 Tax=Halteria grandinella TaxID=5974 RepID=A0A8J8NF72_HALGN|nr:hypothetical protein FGO68_gene3767 [Halteria grandinella]
MRPLTRENSDAQASNQNVQSPQVTYAEEDKRESANEDDQTDDQVEKQRESKDDKSPGLKHVSFLLKAAHSLSKYHTLPSDKIVKLTIKYLKQKEKRIKEGMRYFLSVSPKQPDISVIIHKIILVCKAIIKVISHKHLQHLRQEYSYMNVLEQVCKRLIEKFEKQTEDGVGEIEALHINEEGSVESKGNGDDQQSDQESENLEEEMSENQIPKKKGPKWNGAGRKKRKMSEQHLQAIKDANRRRRERQAIERAESLHGAEQEKQQELPPRRGLTLTMSPKANELESNEKNEVTKRRRTEIQQSDDDKSASNEISKQKPSSPTYKGQKETKKRTCKTLGKVKAEGENGKHVQAPIQQKPLKPILDAQMIGNGMKIGLNMQNPASNPPQIQVPPSYNHHVSPMQYSAQYMNMQGMHPIQNGMMSMQTPAYHQQSNQYSKPHPRIKNTIKVIQTTQEIDEHGNLVPGTEHHKTYESDQIFNVQTPQGLQLHQSYASQSMMNIIQVMQQCQFQSEQHMAAAQQQQQSNNSH